MQLLASAAVVITLLTGSAPAGLTDWMNNGGLSQYGGGGGSHSKPIIRLQPAPQKPWVREEDLKPFPDEWIWNPYTSRDRRPLQPHDQQGRFQKRTEQTSGQCNAATPLGCW
jgi:hypothetical protein